MNDIIENFDEMINDVAKALCQMLIVHIFSAIVDSEGELLSQKMLSRTVYIVIAIILYHVVVKKIIFKKSKNVKHKNTHHKKLTVTKESETETMNFSSESNDSKIENESE